MNYHDQGVESTITTTEQTIAVANAQNTAYKGFFVYNAGASAVTYKIYGSPTGVKIGDRDENGHVFVVATEALHWQDLGLTGVINNGERLGIDLSSYHYNYFKLTLSTASGTASTKSWFQEQKFL